MNGVKYPEVSVQLAGENGNVFNLISVCRRAARKAGVERAEIDRFCAEAMAVDSYGDAVRVMMAWFDCN